MIGIIFIDTLRRSWRGVLGWGLGVGFLGIVQMSILSDVNSIRQMADLMQSLPPIMLQMLGMDGMDAAFMATPEGYLAFRFFSFMLVIFAVYSVNAGLNISINEEDRGILDIVLSLPTERWQLILGRFLAYCLNIIVIILMVFLSIWVGVAITPSVEINMQSVFLATLNIIPGTLVVLAVTMLISTVVRRRGTALIIASVFVVASYFIDAFASSVSEGFINTLRAVSFFAYYDSTSVIRDGLNWSNIGILSAVVVITFFAGEFFFQRRNIGV